MKTFIIIIFTLSAQDGGMEGFRIDSTIRTEKNCLEKIQGIHPVRNGKFDVPYCVPFEVVTT